MKKNIYAAFGAIVFLALSTQGMALANPVVLNGSFETPVQAAAPSNWTYLNNTITGDWNFQENASGGNSGIAAYNSTWATSTPVPGGGNQVGFFQGGQMTQVLTGFNPFTRYSLSFWLENRPGYTSVDPLTVSVGSYTLGTYTAPSNTSFTYFQTPYFDFGATPPSSATLSLVAASLTSTGVFTDKAVAIDMIDINVDEPSSFAILGVGLLLMAGLNRQLRREV